jgi:hypothetical protein
MLRQIFRSIFGQTKAVGHARTDEQHNIARRTIGPLEGSIEGLSAEQKFEWFDPQKLILAFRGDLFEIQPLVDAIVTLKEKADAVNAHPWWQTD